MEQVYAVKRLPLIFDLDETLIVAKSVSQLQRELSAEACARRRRRLAEDAPAGRQEHRVRLAALEREEALMQADLALLQQYAASDRVTVRGVEVEAK